MESYLAELKNLVKLHSTAQNISRNELEYILKEINSEHDGKSSWGEVWLKYSQLSHKVLDKIQKANLGRFPYVSNQSQKKCEDLAIEAFGLWAEKIGATRVAVSGEGGTGFAWMIRGRRDGPTILIMGGIVSTKEQWGQLLPLFKRLRLNAIVTEMPGVGENTLKYTKTYTNFITKILDAAGISEDADVRVLSLSFSFTLALHAALNDSRIQAIVTVGGPVCEFFNSPNIWSLVPETTRRTWAHILDTDLDSAFAVLVRNNFPVEKLSEISIPLSYVGSLRDEIIPASDANTLKELAPNVELFFHDDVHGSPSHMRTTQIWLFLQLLGSSTQQCSKSLFCRLIRRLAKMMVKVYSVQNPSH